MALLTSFALALSAFATNASAQNSALAQSQPLDAIVKVETDSGTGTGWFINSFVVVTDAHLIRGALWIHVLYKDGVERDASIRKENDLCDVADLTVIDPRPLQGFLRLITDSDSLLPHTHVRTIGYPLGQRCQAQGTLDHRLLEPNGLVSMFGSDNLSINPGASGSPVYDDSGRVVGMINAMSTNINNYQCYIITANVIWEALAISNPDHPQGFVTGVTNGLDLGRNFID